MICDVSLTDPLSEVYGCDSKFYRINEDEEVIPTAVLLVQQYLLCDQWRELTDLTVTGECEASEICSIVEMMDTAVCCVLCL